MKELIKHLVNNHLDRIVDKSFLNCHVEGLHSVMLLDSPEQTIRLFVSESNSKLVKNTLDNIRVGKQTLAFHPHHCNLTLHVVKGRITNHIVKTVSHDDHFATSLKPSSDTFSRMGYFFAHKYRYESSIGSYLRFNYLQQLMLQFIDTRDVYEGESIFLKATDIHTVTTYEPGVTAWFVYEGKEDANYIPFCYNVSYIKEEDYKGLYMKPTHQQVLNLLEVAGML